jgi:pyruvate dehydrogenase E1 component alpha subunit
LLAAHAAAREARERLFGRRADPDRGGHHASPQYTTADDPLNTGRKKKSKSERPDPVIRLQKYLTGKGLWDEGLERKFRGETEEKIYRAVQEAETISPPPVEDIFRYTYSQMTPVLKEQLADYQAFLKEKES